MTAAWLPQAFAGHRVIATVSTALAVGCATLVPGPSFTLQLALLAVAVAFFGVPHGALDHVLARSARRSSPAAFFAGYVGAVLAAVAFWWLSPALALVAFLALSAAHFGEGDRFARPSGARPKWLEVAARGLLPVTLPATFHGDEVAIAFDALLPAHASVGGAALANGVAGAGWLALALLPWVVVTARASARRGLLAELFVLTSALVFLPPLLGFAVYFCLWHSLRHSIWLAAQLDESSLVRGFKEYLRRSLLLTACALAGMGVAWWLTSADLDGVRAGARVLFVGLFALTVPHARIVHRAFAQGTASGRELSDRRAGSRDARVGIGDFR